MKSIIQLLILFATLSCQTQTTQNQIQLPDNIQIEPPFSQDNQIQIEPEQIVKQEINVVFDTIKGTTADTIYLGTPARYYSEKDTIVANHRFIKYRRWKHSRELIVLPNDSFSYELVFYLDSKRINSINPSRNETYKLTKDEFRFYKGSCLKEVWKYQQVKGSLFYLERQIGQTIDKGYANSLVPYDRAGHQFVTTNLNGDTLYTIDYQERKRRNYIIEYRHSKREYHAKTPKTSIKIDESDSFDQQILKDITNKVYDKNETVCFNGMEGLSVFRVYVNKEGKLIFDQRLRTTNYLAEEDVIRKILTLPNIEPFTKNGKPVDVEWSLLIRFKYDY